jgi:hypothetical protein
MANPFLGQSSTHSPSAVTDHYGDDSWFDSAHLHVAGMLLFALVVLTAMQMSGFRAMVGIGRG